MTAKSKPTARSAPSEQADSFQRGLAAEDRVAFEAAQRLGWQLLRHRWKTPFAELDLVFVGPSGGWIVCEVKTLSPWSDLTGGAFRLRGTQRDRLRRAMIWITEGLGQPAEFVLALVTHDGEVEWIWDVLG